MRILSWNIQWGRGIDGRVDLARIAGALRPYEADVLCLQEVAVNHPGLPGGAAMDQVAWLSGLFLGYESTYGAGSDLPDGMGGRRQFGNLILSRFPILQVFRHSLPWPVDTAVPSMPRVALEAVIDAPGFPGGALRVITTHLEYYSDSQRLAQFKALRTIADNGWQHATQPRSAADTDPPFAVLPRGEGCVLCGDFNSELGSEGHAALWMPSDAPAFRDAGIAVPPVPQGFPSVTPTFGVHDRCYVAQPMRYDGFYISENIAERVRAVEVDTHTQASDHQPVLLELQ